MTLGLYIDPGVHALACAYFQSGSLINVAMTPREEFAVRAPCTLDELVIERMIIYKGKADDGKDPNDLLDVTAAAAFAEGAIVARGGPRAQWVYAKDWKGSIKKPHHHLRLWSVLTPLERAVMSAAIGMTCQEIETKINEACRRLALTRKVTGYAWQAHNLFDAIGIGLWHQKRTGIAGHRFCSGQS